MGQRKRGNPVTRTAAARRSATRPPSVAREPVKARSPVLLITQSQLSEGYYERRGMIGWNRRYRVIRDNGDGTLIVIDPRSEP